MVYLDKQPFAVLQVLWNRRNGEAVPAEDGQLLRVAFSVENVYVLINRLRSELEPDPDKPVYIINKRGTGYWLENVYLERKTV